MYISRKGIQHMILNVKNWAREALPNMILIFFHGNLGWSQTCKNNDWKRVLLIVSDCLWVGKAVWDSPFGWCLSPMSWGCLQQSVYIVRKKAIRNIEVAVTLWSMWLPHLFHPNSTLLILESEKTEIMYNLKLPLNSLNCHSDFFWSYLDFFFVYPFCSWMVFF